MAIPRWFLNSLGTLAAICTTISFLPQLLTVWRRKSGHGISLAMFLLFAFGVALWLAYGIILGSFPLILANGVTLTLTLAIIVLKLRYDRRAGADAAASAQAE